MKKQIADFLGELAEEMGWSPETGEPRVKAPTSRPLPAPGQPSGSLAAAPARGTAPAPAPGDEAPGQFETRTHRMDLIETQVKQLRRTVDHLASEITNLRTELARLRHMPLPPDAPEAMPSVASPPATTPTTEIPRPAPVAPVDDPTASEPEPLPPPETSSTSPLSMFPAEPRKTSEPTRLDLFR